jgi:hypothetical protein
VTWLIAAQRALRTRFDDMARALRRGDTTALDVALFDFEHHLARWTAGEEQALLPAIARTGGVPGRDPQRELRLEFVQLRELARFMTQQRTNKVRPHDLLGYLENLDRRLFAHEREMNKVYYPLAAPALTEEEWNVLEAARAEE